MKGNVNRGRACWDDLSGGGGRTCWDDLLSSGSVGSSVGDGVEDSVDRNSVCWDGGSVCSLGGGCVKDNCSSVCWDGLLGGGCVRWDGLLGGCDSSSLLDSSSLSSSLSSSSTSICSSSLSITEMLNCSLFKIFC